MAATWPCGHAGLSPAELYGLDSGSRPSPCPRDRYSGRILASVAIMPLAERVNAFKIDAPPQSSLNQSLAGFDSVRRPFGRVRYGDGRGLSAISP